MPVPVQLLVTSRVCCRYAHVNPTCLENSPTNSWHKRYEAAGGRHEDLVAHIEERADYDGLAVRWGINHKTESVEECAEACRNHKPNPLGSGPFDALPCNVFVWCGGAEECFEPDAHHHVRISSFVYISLSIPENLFHVSIYATECVHGLRLLCACGNKGLFGTK